MKKVILILAVLLVSAVTWQCTQDEEVYIDEQIIIVDDITKGEELPDPEDTEDDGSGSVGGDWVAWCVYENPSGYSHVIQKKGYSYRCIYRGSVHTYPSSKTAAEYHCRTGY